MHFGSYREVEIVDQIIPVINQNERDFEDPSDVEDVAQEYAPLEIPKKKKRVQNPPKRKKWKLLKISKINPQDSRDLPSAATSETCQTTQSLPPKVSDIPSKSLPKST